MRRILALGCFGVLILTPFGVGSPIGGAFSDNVELVDETWTMTKTFRAGERACVLAVGSREAAANMTITVKDTKGTVIAEDKAAGNLTGNIVAVTWYPPRDGEYRIEVRHPGSRDCYVAIK